MNEADFVKAVKAVLQAELTPLQNELKALKSDLLEVSNQNQKLKMAIAEGKGLQRNSSDIDASEFKKFAPLRIASASLGEVCDYLAESEGIDPLDSRQWQKWSKTDGFTQSKGDKA